MQLNSSWNYSWFQFELRLTNVYKKGWPLCWVILFLWLCMVLSCTVLARALSVSVSFLRQNSDPILMDSPVKNQQIEMTQHTQGTHIHLCKKNVDSCIFNGIHWALNWMWKVVFAAKSLQKCDLFHWSNRYDVMVRWCCTSEWSHSKKMTLFWVLLEAWHCQF